MNVSSAVATHSTALSTEENKSPVSSPLVTACVAVKNNATVQINSKYQNKAAATDVSFPVMHTSVPEANLLTTLNAIQTMLEDLRKLPASAESERLHIIFVCDFDNTLVEKSKGEEVLAVGLRQQEDIDRAAEKLTQITQSVDYSCILSARSGPAEDHQDIVTSLNKLKFSDAFNHPSLFTNAERKSAFPEMTLPLKVPRHNKPIDVAHHGAIFLDSLGENKGRIISEIARQYSAKNNLPLQDVAVLFVDDNDQNHEAVQYQMRESQQVFKYASIHCKSPQPPADAVDDSDDDSDEVLLQQYYSS